MPDEERGIATEQELDPSASTRVLHEQTGLRIWKNPRNGFTVARLHFTADARKRSQEWIAESKRGMGSAKWEQEFNINYASHAGEKAFPEIVLRRHEIVVPEGPYIDNEWPSNLTMYAGFDYGARNPSSMHVYTVVDEVVYAIWELYGPCKNIYDFTSRMKECPYWDQIRYLVHDPDMDSLKSHNMQTGNTASVKQHFESAGITKWVKGNNDEAAWLATMQKHWSSPQITFKILDCCPMLIDEFENATFKTLSDKALLTSDAKEQLMDKHNHGLDDCKYFMNSSLAGKAVRKLNIPSLATSYSTRGAPGRTQSYENRRKQLGLLI